MLYFLVEDCSCPETGTMNSIDNRPVARLKQLRGLSKMVKQNCKKGGVCVKAFTHTPHFLHISPFTLHSLYIYIQRARNIFSSLMTPLIGESLDFSFYF